MKEDKLKNDLDKLLNPKRIQKNLIKSSLYLTAFELLKFAVEKRLKNFLCMNQPMDENYEYQSSQEYKDCIVNRQIPELNNNKNIYYSSSLWLMENDVITLEEVEELQKIRLHRNIISHELPKLMVDSDHEINLELFESIKKLLAKIERWWIIEFEMAIDQEYDNFDYDTLDVNEIKSGNMILLEHLIEMIDD